ncbi:hypothetical protein [Pectobacterium quasiaquaticum]|uniref:hypothetical protein n=1 Tax=Pectobacterium quasiaquaticum TaxID=2774015 RepID=UPI003D35C236
MAAIFLFAAHASGALADEYIRASDGLITFEPGACSVWHTHPAGQRLAVISMVNGKNVAWMEKVSDEQYQGH